MGTIEEMLQEVETEKIEPAAQIGENVEASKIDLSGIFNILKAQSIDKPVEDYQDHALNFDRKKSTGRIIRGFEGLMGALNYAIIDIILGFYEKSREKVKENAA